MTLKRWKSVLFCCVLVLLTALPLQQVFGQDAEPAQGGIFGAYEAQPESRVEIPVEIRDVSDLYAIDIQIEFNPEVVQVEDADPNQDGIQPALGTFLDAGLTLFNEVDNEAGLVRFVMTQVNPSEAKSGSGVVLVLYLSGSQTGVSDLDVTVLELSTRAGQAIEVEPVSGSVTVSADAPEADGTSIPVQDSGLLVAIPTVLPTAVPTPTEAAPEGKPAGDDSNAVNDSEENPASAESNRSVGSDFSLVEDWWIVLAVVIFVVGFGIILGVSRK